MHKFSRLLLELETARQPELSVAAMRRYFADAPARDAAWAVYLLLGRRPKRVMTSAKLRELAARVSGLPDWLVEESSGVVGDAAEAAALLVPSSSARSNATLAEWIDERLDRLAVLEGADREAAIAAAWQELDVNGRFVFNRLLTGSFRPGVALRLVVKALAETGGLRPEVVAHRLSGKWEPSPDSFQRLLRPDTEDAGASLPYPFQLADRLEGDLASLGEISCWLVEWKWDGCRAQLVRRGGRVSLWTLGGELVTDRFPELAEAAALLPDGAVLDGEIVALADGIALSSTELARRLGRTTPSAKLRREVPATFVAFDLLEIDSVDIRGRALADRRAALADLMESLVGLARPILRLSPVVEAQTWEALEAERARARGFQAEGLVLKLASSTYGTSGRRGDWLTCRADPLSVLGVLIYAERVSSQPGMGSTFTFALWRGGELVPFARVQAEPGTDEVLEIERFVRENTRERFGPVRSVEPRLVFELAFEGICRSARHRSGVSVRNARIVAWKRGCRAEEADTFDAVDSMLELPSAEWSAP